MKNITFSAEDVLIARAREKARKEQKTLNALFREWLRRYIDLEKSQVDFEAFMNHASYASAGGTFSRDEMNAR